MIIPKKLHHLWVGEKPAPMHWINTWREKHPDWEHILWDNDKVFGRQWKNQRLVDHYQKTKTWHGVADVVRYEILNEQGGLFPGADSVCFHNLEELLQDDNFDIYSVYENERVRPGLVSPIQASTPDNEFLKIIINHLSKINVIGIPWKTTGNLLMQKMIEKHKPARMKVWASHILIPVHYTGTKYQGTEKVYADQMFGTTKNLYKRK